MLKRLLQALKGPPQRKDKQIRGSPPAPKPEMPSIRVPGGSGDAGISVRISTLSREEGHHSASRAFDLVDYVLAALIIGIASIAANLTHFQSKSVPVEVQKAAQSVESGPKRQSASQGSRLSGSRPGASASRPGVTDGQAGGSDFPSAPMEDGPPEPIQTVPAVYTQQARNSGFHGKVFAIVSVTPQGSADGVQFATPVPFDLESPARDAVKQWRFRPAIRHGSPAAGKCFVEIPFR